MQKQYFDFEPELTVNEGSTVRINFDVEHTTEERQTETGETEEVEVIKAYSVRVPQPITRSRIIDAIVTAAYPIDVMQAIINNHLLDPSDHEHEQEYDAMQAWRAHAKQIANQVLNPV